MGKSKKILSYVKYSSLIEIVFKVLLVLAIFLMSFKLFEDKGIERDPLGALLTIFAIGLGVYSVVYHFLRKDLLTKFISSEKLNGANIDKFIEQTGLEFVNDKILSRVSNLLNIVGTSLSFTTLKLVDFIIDKDLKDKILNGLSKGDFSFLGKLFLLVFVVVLFFNSFVHKDMFNFLSGRKTYNEWMFWLRKYAEKI